jgi:hypothetical protein
MEFNRKADGSRKITCKTRWYRNGIWTFVYGITRKTSNYDTDVFYHLLKK